MRKLFYTPWIVLGFAIMLALSGCAGTTTNVEAPAEVQSVQALDQKCIAYGIALRSLAVLRVQDMLSEDQIATVEFTKRMVDPICASNTSFPFDPDNIAGWQDALKIVEAALFKMAFIQEDL